jgi:hypothetical protein
VYKALVRDLVLDSGLNTLDICHITVIYSGLQYEHSHSLCNHVPNL